MIDIFQSMNRFVVKMIKDVVAEDCAEAGADHQHLCAGHLQALGTDSVEKSGAAGVKGDKQQQQPARLGDQGGAAADIGKAAIGKIEQAVFHHLATGCRLSCWTEK